MELYFLRHAIAADRADPKYKNDSLRPLTAQGLKKMRRAAQGMRSLCLTFDTILSSPYVRARQTAEMVAQIYQLKNKRIHLTNNLLAPASIKELLEEIQTHFPKSRKVLLVGHEPHLTESISCLLKNGRPLNIDLKKGSLCCLGLDDMSKKPTAIFKWLLTSKQLGLIARESRSHKLKPGL